MALNGKYVKINRILDGVFRDYGWTHEVNWVDAVEWVGEVMDLIGAPKQYVDKITDGNEDIGNPCPIIIKNYRGELPCDMVYIDSAREGKGLIPMRYSSDTFHRGLEKSENNSTVTSIPISSPLVVGNSLLNDSCQSDLTYTLNDCYIFTNFKEGTVQLDYKAFPTDTEGLPLIPDNVKYIQAVKAYIASKIGQKLWMQNKIDGGKFNHLQSECAWYIGAATTAGLMPNVDEMESWKNQYVRLIPNLEQHNSSFKYMGDSQKYVNQNSI
jgi:hypothetical protein